MGLGELLIEDLGTRLGATVLSWRAMFPRQHAAARNQVDAGASSGQKNTNIASLASAAPIPLRRNSRFALSTPPHFQITL
jgi:hypothetical protein